MSFSRLSWEGVLDWLLGPGLLIAITVAVAFVARWLVVRGLTHAVAQADRSRLVATDDRRLATLARLLRSVVTFAVVCIAALTVMAIIGIPLGPLLASAGVGGVALGFGAQSLVKDYLSGIFMILEGQFAVGDRIDTGEAVGVVEDVSLRITRLRDANGVIWHVRNGEIVRVANRSQGFGLATIDIPIAYSADVQMASDAVRRCIAGMQSEERWANDLIKDPEFMGVESLTGGAITLRVFAHCKPDRQFGVKREIAARVQSALDRAGVPRPTLPGNFGPPGA